MKNIFLTIAILCLSVFAKATYLPTAGIKVNAAVSNSASIAASSNSTLYTAPANGYAVVTVATNCTSSCDDTLNVGGFPSGSWYSQVSGASSVQISSASGTSIYVTSGAGLSVRNGVLGYNLYVGPGKAVNVSRAAGVTTSTYYITGVEYINN